MSFFGSYETSRPWFHVGQVAVSSTILLVGVLTVSMILCTLAVAAGLNVGSLALSTSDVWRQHEWWRVVTWPFVDAVSLWFVLAMVMLFFFGRSVEQVLGRVDFLKLVGGIALALTVVTLCLPRAGLVGFQHLGTAVFLAFAIMHPSAIIWCALNVTAKWWAIILLSVHTLMNIAAHNWTGQIQLVTMVAATAIGLRMLGSAHSLPWLNVPSFSFKRSPRPGSLARGSTDGVWRKEDSSIDALLDKVAEKGLHSLSEKERALLARHSEKLQRRGS